MESSKLRVQSMPRAANEIASRGARNDGRRGGSKKRDWRPCRYVILAAVVSLVLILAGCKPRAAKSDANAPMETQGLAVQIQTVAAGTIDNRLCLSGVVAPSQMVMAFPKVPGKLVENKVKEGDAVARDQVLALVNRDEPGQEFKDYEVTAPIAGVVAKVSLDPGSTVAPGVPVTTIIDIDNVKVTVSVIEADVGQIRVGMAADATVPAYPNRTFRGSVSNILPLVDPMSHTTKVEVLIPNEGHFLRPGMSACVNLRLGEHRQTVVIPRNAVIEKMGEKYVYLFADGKARRSNIQTAYDDGTNVEVTSGVNAGDRLVVSDLNVLNDGAKIQAKAER